MESTCPNRSRFRADSHSFRKRTLEQGVTWSRAIPLLPIGLTIGIIVAFRPH